MKPERVQLQRRRGFKMGAAASNGLPIVKVDRTTRWGNPYRVGDPVDMKQARRWGWKISPNGRRYVCETVEDAVMRFSYALTFDQAIHPFVREQLGGKNLACWCAPGSSCHADILLELANREA